MSTSGVVTGVTSGASLGSVTYGVPGAIIGGVLGGIGGAFGLFDTKPKVEKVTDIATPYRVKLPSGAIITMYAHGNPTKTTSGGEKSTGSQILDIASVGVDAYNKSKKTPEPITPIETATPTPISVIP